MAKALKVRKVDSDDPVDRAAPRILRTRLREFYSHWPAPDVVPDDETLHNLRISGKRLRYTAEMLRSIYPDRLALLIELLKRSQDILGEYQDCVTQRRLLELELARIARRTPDSQEIPALRSIIEIHAARQKTLIALFQDIWRGMSTNKMRSSFKQMVRMRKEERELAVTGEKS